MVLPSSHNIGRRLRDLLLEHDSATETLQKLCDRPVHAVLLDDNSLPDSTLTALLEFPPRHDADATAVRHVKLFGGPTLISEAWNVYIPNRLTDEARQTLSDHHTPFGRAVGSAYFWRERVSSRLTNLPQGIILENRALLRRKIDNLPIAAVLERYTPAALPRAYVNAGDTN